MSWFRTKPNANKPKHRNPVKRFGPIAQEQWDNQKSINKKNDTKKLAELNQGFKLNESN